MTLTTGRGTWLPGWVGSRAPPPPLLASARTAVLGTPAPEPSAAVASGPAATADRRDVVVLAVLHGRHAGLPGHGRVNVVGALHCVLQVLLDLQLLSGYRAPDWGWQLVPPKGRHCSGTAASLKRWVAITKQFH